jgi:hypothetical protein
MARYIQLPGHRRDLGQSTRNRRPAPFVSIAEAYEDAGRMESEESESAGSRAEHSTLGALRTQPGRRP